MPKEKIVIGIATYAIGWTLADAGQTGIDAAASGPSKATEYVRIAGSASYYEVRAQYSISYFRVCVVQSVGIVYVFELLSSFVIDVRVA